MIEIATHPWLSGFVGDAEMATIFAPDAELKRFLRIEAAWTRALGHVASHSGAETIAAAIEAAPISPDMLAAGTAKDGVPIPTLVRLLRDHVDPDCAHLVHTGLTSQDVMDTGLMLALREVLALLAERLKTLNDRLIAMQDAFGDLRMMAFTRMQPALETTVKEVIGRWRQPLAKLISDAADLQKITGIIQWGGPIGTRNHPQADRLGAAFADHLDLSDPGRSWHTDRTVILEIAQFLSRMTNAIGKMGDDVALYALARPEDISFVGGGSSAMPHKNNPVKAEALSALADFGSVLAANMTATSRHEGFRSGRAWIREWLTLPQLCFITGAATVVAINMVDDISAIGTP